MGRRHWRKRLAVIDSIHMAACFDLPVLNTADFWASELMNEQEMILVERNSYLIDLAWPPGFHQQETTDVEQRWWLETRCKPRCRFTQWLQKASNSRPVCDWLLCLCLSDIWHLCLRTPRDAEKSSYCSTLLRLVGKPPQTNTSSFSASPSAVEVLEHQLHPCPIWIWLPLCFLRWNGWN